MSRVAPVLLFSTALALMASIQTKSEAQTASGIPDYFFSTYTVNRDCTEAHAGGGGHTLPGSQFKVSRSSADGGGTYTLQVLDKPGFRWSSGWKGVKLEYRAGARMQSIPADFACIPGEEESQPFLAQSGFAVSGEPQYPYERWYGTVKIHGQLHHLLIFPRNAKGPDSAAVLLIDTDASGNLQLDENGAIIVEN
jgi:hypothetical protein